jgi:hypothetical protein
MNSERWGMAERKPKDRHKDEDDTTEFENFQELLKDVLSVPKEELDKRRAEYERERKEKRTR